jgi:N-acetylglucosamine malate deacetylase 2
VASLLDTVASDRRVAQPVALVVAHPDDETLGLGSRLAALARLTIVHLTGGSPRRLDDAHRAGFDDRAAYAAARRRELDAALAALGAASATRLAYDQPDQETILAIDAIVDRLAVDLDGIAAVITHSYEHGHPDHDSAALAVALACRCLAARGRSAPQRLEFASYHLRQGEPAYGVFWPEPARPERRIMPEGEALARKRAAIACHATQRDVVARVPLAPERLRAAPDYDFGAAAPPRSALYDRYGWDMTSTRWRALAARAWADEPGANGEEPWQAAPAHALAR